MGYVGTTGQVTALSGTASPGEPTHPTTASDVAADPRRDVLAIGAWSGEVPAGLALMSRMYGDARRRLWSMAVAPAFRRNGIGIKLVAACEQAAAETGTKMLIAIHSSRMAAPAAYEGLMHKAGWTTPKPAEYRVAGRRG